MRREVSHYQHHHIRQGTALGELNHPSYYSSYFKSLNLPNVSHQVRAVLTPMSAVQSVSIM